MILSTFRNNQLTASFLLIFYTAVLHLPFFWQGRLATVSPDPGAAYLSQWLIDGADWNLWMAVLFPVVMLFVTGMAINQLAARDHLGQQVTQLPGLFYILVASFVAVFFFPHSIQLANLVLLFALFPFLRLYKNNNPQVPLFWTGWWLGIAFLTNRYFLIFLPAFVLSITVLTSLNFRRVLQMLAGWLAPLFLLSAYKYLSNDLEEFLAFQFQGYGWPTTWLSEPRWTQLGLMALGIGLLWVLISYEANTKLLRTAGKKKLNIFYTLLLFTGFSLLLQPSLGASSAQIIALPLGTILGVQFARMSRSSGETWHLLILAVFTALQLYPFFLRLGG